jgi:hypothetical protein
MHKKSAHVPLRPLPPWFAAALRGLDLLATLARYNLKIIFIHRFVYFVLAAVAFFIAEVWINIAAGKPITSETLYKLLLLPGILLVFYPAVFGIQNDADAQMIEVIFGIPDYRYTVWLFRLLLCMALTGIALFVLGLGCGLVRLGIPVFAMTFHLLFPVFFWGALAFLFSTLVKNAYGAAAMLVFIGLGFWVFNGSFPQSQWNVFLDPFSLPPSAKELLWHATVRSNRILLAAAGVVAILWGLRNLQKREQFL